MAGSEEPESSAGGVTGSEDDPLEPEELSEEELLCTGTRMTRSCLLYSLRSRYRGFLLVRQRDCHHFARFHIATEEHLCKHALVKYCFLFVLYICQRGSLQRLLPPVELGQLLPERSEAA